MVTDIWSEFLIIANQEAGSRVVETWFKAVTLTNWDRITKTVSLEVPNQFVKEWIKAHYFPLMESHLKRLLHVDTLHIHLTDSSKTSSQPILKTTTPELTQVPALNATEVKISAGTLISIY